MNMHICFTCRICAWVVYEHWIMLRSRCDAIDFDHVIHTSGPGDGWMFRTQTWDLFDGRVRDRQHRIWRTWYDLVNLECLGHIPSRWLIYIRIVTCICCYAITIYFLYETLINLAYSTCIHVSLTGRRLNPSWKLLQPCENRLEILGTLNQWVGGLVIRGRFLDPHPLSGFHTCGDVHRVNTTTYIFEYHNLNTSM